MRPTLAATAALALAACGGETVPQPAETQPAASASAPAAGASAAAPAIAPAGAARAVKQSTALYEFDYAYPAAAGAIADLKRWLDSDLDAQKAKLAQAATKWQAEAKAEGIPYHPYANSTKWQVVTDLPGWLSLSAQIYEYTGGAHGMTAHRGLLWDRTADVRRAPIDLFTAPAALSAAIRAPFCDALDRERAKRRGQPVNRASGQMFDECVDPVKNAVILGSTDGQHFTRIGILVGPYEAGPYAEGTYDITVPVTAAVLKTVKPEYRSAFAPR